MKIGIVGCGVVGSTAGYTMVLAGGCSELVLIDINQDLARANAEALALAGFDIDKKKIVMEPIKKLGEYSVTVKLHTNLSAEVKVNVVQE